MSRIIVRSETFQTTLVEYNIIRADLAKGFIGMKPIIYVCQSSSFYDTVHIGTFTFCNKNFLTIFNNEFLIYCDLISSFIIHYSPLLYICVGVCVCVCFFPYLQ